MKTIKQILAVLLVASTTLLYSCTIHQRTSTETVQKELSNPVFQKLYIGSFFKVKFTQADTYKVNITISKHLESNLVAKVDNGRLIVSFNHIDIPYDELSDADKAELEICAPSFKELEMEGASKFTFNGKWTLGDISFILKGASKLTCENILAKNVSFDQSGASHVKAKLTAENLKILTSGASKTEIESSSKQIGSKLFINTSGASKMDLSELAFDYVKVNTSGASEVSVNPHKILDVGATGATKIRYNSTNDHLKKFINTSGIASVKEM